MRILCECDDPTCHEQIELSMDEILFLRGGETNRFIIIPGHESDTDRIVATDSMEKFVVVENDV